MNLSQNHSGINLCQLKDDKLKDIQHQSQNSDKNHDVFQEPLMLKSLQQSAHHQIKVEKDDVKIQIPQNTQQSIKMNFQISILNQKGGEIINSPRSLKAMKALGINQQDLVQTSKTQIISSGIPVEFKADTDFYAQVKFDHLEKKRNQLINKLVIERQTIYTISSSSDRVRIRQQDVIQGQQDKKISKLQLVSNNEINRFIKTETDLSIIEYKTQSRAMRTLDLDQRKQEKTKLKQQQNLVMQYSRLERQQEVGQKRINQNEQTQQKFDQDNKKWELKKLLMEQDRERVQKETSLIRKDRQDHTQINQEQILQNKSQQDDYKNKSYDQKVKNFDEVYQNKISQHSLLKKNSLHQKKVILHLSQEQKLQESYNLCKKQQNQYNEKIILKNGLLESRMQNRQLNREATLQERQNSQQQRQNDIRYKQDLIESEREQKQIQLSQKQQDFNSKMAIASMDFSITSQKRYELRHQREIKAQENVKQAYVTKVIQDEEFMENLQDQIERAEQIRQLKLLEIKRKYIMKHLYIEDAMKQQNRLEQVNNDKSYDMNQRRQQSIGRLDAIQEEQVSMKKQRNQLKQSLQIGRLQLIYDFKYKKSKNPQKIDLNLVNQSYQQIEQKSYESTSIFNHTPKQRYSPQNYRNNSVQERSEYQTQKQFLPSINRSSDSKMENQTLNVSGEEKSYQYKYDSTIPTESTHNMKISTRSPQRIASLSINMKNISQLSAQTQEAVKIYGSPIKQYSKSLINSDKLRPSCNTEGYQSELPQSEQYHKSRFKVVRSYQNKVQNKTNKKGEGKLNDEMNNLSQNEITKFNMLNDPNVQDYISYRLHDLQGNHDKSKSKILAYLKTSKQGQ